LTFSQSSFDQEKLIQVWKPINRACKDADYIKNDEFVEDFIPKFFDFKNQRPRDHFF
jgi:hypothetical protein